MLFALNSYRAAHGENPPSLQALVPKYIESIPLEPEFNYKPELGSLWFAYTPTWPQEGRVSCSAEFGARGFGCSGYI